MGINIGFFKAVDGGYQGKITTLLHNLTVTFERVIARTNEKAPAFHIYSGQLQLGAAWERKTKKGSRYLGVSLEDPTFSAGYYNFYRNDGVEDGYKLTKSTPSTWVLRQQITAPAP